MQILTKEQLQSQVKDGKLNFFIGTGGTWEATKECENAIMKGILENTMTPEARAWLEASDIEVNVQITN